MIFDFDSTRPLLGAANCINRIQIQLKSNSKTNISGVSNEAVFFACKAKTPLRTGVRTQAYMI